MQRLYLTRVGIPDELRSALSQQAQRESEAKGELKRSEYAIQAARNYSEAAGHYATPQSQFAALLGVSQQAAQNGKNIFINGSGGLVQSLREFIGTHPLQPSQPTKSPSKEIIVP